MDTARSGTGRRARLLGRTRERATLDGLVGDMRRGKSRALVLRGDAGIGKTALLEHLVESAPDLNVVRATGVHSEMELPFASLHQLCAPLLDRLDGIPAPQRRALRTVFGLADGAAPDRWHLHHVFTKLGIGSRKGLPGALRDSDDEAIPA